MPLNPNAALFVPTFGAVTIKKFHGYAPNTPTWLEAKPPRELADAPRSGAGWVD